MPPPWQSGLAETAPTLARFGAAKKGDAEGVNSPGSLRQEVEHARFWPPVYCGNYVGNANGSKAAVDSAPSGAGPQQFPSPSDVVDSARQLDQIVHSGVRFFGVDQPRRGESVITDQQTLGELTVFGQFVEVCPLPIRIDSITKQESPDVLCEVEGQGQLAFEITEIVDPKLAAPFYSNLTLKGRIWEVFDQLPPADKAKIVDRNIYIEFNEPLSMGLRERELPNILSWITGVAANFAGDLTIPGPSQDVVRQVRVWPAEGPPLFDIRSRGSHTGPPLKAIEAKLSLAYAEQPPIELLAYYSIQALDDPPLRGWLEQLDALLEERLASSPFRRVWVFDYASKTIDYVRPQP